MWDGMGGGCPCLRLLPCRWFAPCIKDGRVIKCQPTPTSIENHVPLTSEMTSDTRSMCDTDARTELTWRWREWKGSMGDGGRGEEKRRRRRRRRRRGRERESRVVFCFSCPVLRANGFML